MILTRLRVKDEQFWQLNAVHTLRQLHKFKARDMAQFLDLFDRDVLDEMGEPVIITKCEDVFFERIVGLLPMFVKEMSDKHIIRCLEVITKKGLGSQRLFDHYILLMIEKNLLHYTVSLYARMVQAMADRAFVEDYVFWDKFAFRYVFEDPKGLAGQRNLTHAQAKRLWDAFVYLRIKCPTIDVREVLQKLETFMDNSTMRLEADSEHVAAAAQSDA